MTNTYSLALMPSLTRRFFPKSQLAINLLSVLIGSLLLAATAQISIPLPFTPVPITGQTFGVALLSLLWGRNRAFASFLLYLSEGALGLPVFANAQAFLTVGPTMGYLFGMLMATLAVGTLADKGYAKNFFRAFLCCVTGSAIIFTCGLIGLSFFVPKDQLLQMGLFPFMPGDLIKNLLASTVVFTANKRIST